MDFVNEGIGVKSPRHLLYLIEWLPEGSAFNASYAGGMEHYGWTTDRYIQAAIYNAINVNSQMTVSPWLGKGSKGPEFEPLLGPDQAKKKKNAGKKPGSDLKSFYAAMVAGSKNA